LSSSTALDFDSAAIPEKLSCHQVLILDLPNALKGFQDNPNQKEFK